MARTGLSAYRATVIVEPLLWDPKYSGNVALWSVLQVGRCEVGRMSSVQPEKTQQKQWVAGWEVFFTGTSDLREVGRGSFRRNL